MIDPPLARVAQAAAAAPVLLAVHDWSTPAFGTHAAKADRRTLAHDDDLGYDLAAVLMLDGGTGAPIAPCSDTLRSQAGTLGTRADVPQRRVPHVDQAAPAMAFVAAQGWTAPVVHVVDRAADSVGHWRQWNAAKRRALVRADDRAVRHAGAETTLAKVADGLIRQGKMQDAGEVRYRGRPARQFVAEAAVTRHRPAQRRVGARQVEIAGEPLELRLALAEVRGADGRTLARWLLLSNVTAELADAARLATWYYWRWRIESRFKTLKDGGFELERWTQRTADRVPRKLLLALAALADVWALERATDEASADFRLYLMRLSGRSTKRARPVTTTGLLAGAQAPRLLALPGARACPAACNALLEQHLPLFADDGT